MRNKSIDFLNSPQASNLFFAKVIDSDDPKLDVEYLDYDVPKSPKKFPIPSSDETLYDSPRSSPGSSFHSLSRTTEPSFYESPRSSKDSGRDPVNTEPSFYDLPKPRVESEPEIRQKSPEESNEPSFYDSPRSSQESGKQVEELTIYDSPKDRNL